MSLLIAAIIHEAELFGPGQHQNIGSHRSLCAIQLCIVRLSTCTSSLFFSSHPLHGAPGSIMHWNTPTKLDARLVFAQFRFPIVRSALEYK